MDELQHISRQSKTEWEAGRRDIGNVWQLIGIALNFAICWNWGEKNLGEKI